MLKYEVIKNGKVIHSGRANLEKEIQEQLKPYYEHKTFGEPEKIIQSLVSEAIVDEETGEIIQAEMYENIVIPAEYKIVITDITEELKQQDEKIKAKEFLDSTDWLVLKYLRHQALGRSPSMTEVNYLELERQRQEAADKL